MTSAGDPKAMQAAKANLTHGAIGFLIVFMSYWIVQIILNVFGLWGKIDIFR
jgi:lipopolysaccharide export LptBFGC system permease protein LptF